MRTHSLPRFGLLFLWGLILTVAAFAQSFGTLRGTVVLQEDGKPLHNATVLIVELGRTVHTSEDGTYEFSHLPPGKYKVVAHLDNTLTDEAQVVEVAAGAAAKADFRLHLAVLRQEITVTASGHEETAFDSFQSVRSFDRLDLSLKMAPSLGEVLGSQPGIAKRSFGPGPSRPVIRGFDGDRVLVMQDSIPTGTLSSQSGDHGEMIDVSNLERLEVVRGPATLLYGSNAIGGVVNAVSREAELHEHFHEGLQGHIGAGGGSANAYGGGSAGFQYGFDNWTIWGSGGAQRTGDYRTPLGLIENSGTRIRNSGGGLGWNGDRAFFRVGYNYNDSRYGIPFAALVAGEEGGEPVSLTLRGHNVRVTGGVRDLGSVLQAFRLTLNYTDYQHKELEGEEVGTIFTNRQVIYRGVFDQQKRGPLTGSFGFSGVKRKYIASGAEALTPPVNQDGVAVFALQTLDYDRVKFQFGGRLEHNNYDPRELTSRSFTGFSGAAGVQFRLWPGGVLVSNYSHSYRAPALEELYNHGPHPGNVAFEVGDAELKGERGNGVDLSLRHQAQRLRAGVNLYYYRLENFIFPAPTGEIEDGLPEVEYRQGDSRYMGAEATLDVGLHRNLWLNLGADAVDAQLINPAVALPRIPPVRGWIGCEARYKGLSVKPELSLVNSAHQIFPLETPTAGYALWNIAASYTLAGTHVSHVFGVNAFNLGDRLYRNHLSFIKNFAPEIGRGVRFTYLVRFF